MIIGIIKFNYHYLPASEKQVIKEKEKPSGLLKGEGAILLVDDEDIIIGVASGMIESFGFEVLTASSGKQAIEIYRKSKDNIKMVILDMIMPKMSGEETFDRLREINSEVKVLLSSGYSIDGHAADIMDRGCNGFIQKPFNLGELSKSIRSVLDIGEP